MASPGNQHYAIVSALFRFIFCDVLRHPTLRIIDRGLT